MLSPILAIRGLMWFSLLDLVQLPVMEDIPRESVIAIPFSSDIELVWCYTFGCLVFDYCFHVVSPVFRWLILVYLLSLGRAVLTSSKSHRFDFRNL